MLELHVVHEWTLVRCEKIPLLVAKQRERSIGRKREGEEELRKAIERGQGRDEEREEDRELPTFLENPNNIADDCNNGEVVCRHRAQLGDATPSVGEEGGIFSNHV
ncbi:hypothetical protein ACLOJK_022270 [Asimina triloba]